MKKKKKWWKKYNWLVPFENNLDVNCGPWPVENKRIPTNESGLLWRLVDKAGCIWLKWYFVIIRIGCNNVTHKKMKYFEWLFKLLLLALRSIWEPSAEAVALAAHCCCLMRKWNWVSPCKGHNKILYNSIVIQARKRCYHATRIWIWKSQITNTGLVLFWKHHMTGINFLWKNKQIN